MNVVNYIQSVKSKEYLRIGEHIWWIKFVEARMRQGSNFPLISLSTTIGVEEESTQSESNP